MLLVTVDGRQPGYSEGMTLTEFARLFLALGCTDAMNLDGGGSTTMVVRGKIVNSPSDGRERKVGSALALFSLAPPQTPGAPRPATRLVLDPSEASLLAGDTLALTPGGLDQYSEPTPWRHRNSQWEVSRGTGSDQPHRNVHRRPGVRAHHGSGDGEVRRAIGLGPRDCLARPGPPRAYPRASDHAAQLDPTVSRPRL